MRYSEVKCVYRRCDYEGCCHHVQSSVSLGPLAKDCFGCLYSPLIDPWGSWPRLGHEAYRGMIRVAKGPSPHSVPKKKKKIAVPPQHRGSKESPFLYGISNFLFSPHAGQTAICSQKLLQLCSIFGHSLNKRLGGGHNT